MADGNATGRISGEGPGVSLADDERAPPTPGLFRRVITWPAAVKTAVADFLVPPVCLGCERRIQSYDALCPECWRTISFIRHPLCDRLGIPLHAGGDGPLISAAAAANPPVWNRARAVASYDGPMRDLIHALKFHDRHDARRLFGTWLTGAVAELLADTDVLIPVPLSRMRLLTRRFNQAAILTKEVSRLTGITCDHFALQRGKRTRPQVGLTRRQRQENVKGAFSVTPAGQIRLSGRKILLIDDVITTGATMAMAAKVLLDAGAARVDVAALAMVTDQAMHVD